MRREGLAAVIDAAQTAGASIPRGYNSTMLDPEAVTQAMAETFAMLREDNENVRLIARRAVEDSIRVRRQAEDSRRQLAHHPPESN